MEILTTKLPAVNHVNSKTKSGLCKYPIELCAKELYDCVIP